MYFHHSSSLSWKPKVYDFTKFLHSGIGRPIFEDLAVFFSSDCMWVITYYLYSFTFKSKVMCMLYDSFSVMTCMWSVII